MNIAVGPKEDRHLMTGLHTVADIYCRDCREVLGWNTRELMRSRRDTRKGSSYSRKQRL
ncbi:hypothetical protein HU200_038221 [Digitaria exilis]|uniref:Yippee domain-containing protein n=1 Tax=Digitaria exilis TaxID=1010633 RepID=A0A835BCR4_9POAL|nr:hypothetical protein HU200_038221 [Digitaria exilis]